MSDKKYTAINAMADIITSPNKAYDGIRGHNGWLWWPLLITITLGATLQVWYLGWVDFDWFIEQQVRAANPEDQAQVAQAMEMMSPGMMMSFAAIGAVIGSFVLYLIQTVYLHLAAKMAGGGDFRFGDWFSFTAFTWFVSVFASLAAIVVILTASDNRLPAESLAPLSLNNLLVHASPGDPWFTWATYLGLPTLWIIGLTILGYAHWTESSMAKSAIIASLPFVLIFGIWAAVIMA
jgi:hypothetical protein